MALSDDNKRGQIGPSLRGLIYQYERDGKFVTSKWPKKRGRKATEKQKLAQQAFKNVMLAMKLTASNIQIGHRAAAHGTPMLPRDTLMAALYGNGPAITYYSGKVIKPMSNRYLSSTVLDALAWEPGQMLWRGPDTWEPVPVGLPGQVLQSNGPDEAPSWVQPSGGETLRIYQMMEPGGLNTRAYNCKGGWFQPIIDLTLAAVFLKSDARPTDILDFRCYEISNIGKILDVVAEFPNLVPYVSNPQYLRIELPLALELKAGKFYATMVSTRGETNIYATRIYSSGAYPITTPLTELHGWVVLAKEVPVVGDTLERGSGWPYGFSLEFK